MTDHEDGRHQSDAADEARRRIEARLEELEALDLDDRAWYRIREELDRIDELGPFYVAGYLTWAAANPHKVGHAAPRN